uniref:Uncharacterized protein n=1 Tax=Globisporangium ultimum (strain ATCC 200006 / CBS 805.95 / DAOM BR144) TaxID=431595 RepID=K3WEK7_GLOUD
MGNQEKVSKLIFTAADCTVKPIVHSDDIEKPFIPQLQREKLSFHPMVPDDLLSCKTELLENHLKEVYVSLKSSQASTAEKCSVLEYLFTLCLHSKLANVIVNSSMLILLAKMVANLSRSVSSGQSPAETSALLSMVCLVLGVLFRFATFIAPSSPEQLQSLVGTLCQVARESDAFLNTESDRKSLRSARHRSLACLGELLFYISTQKDWDFPAPGLACVIGFLEDQDLILRHYAVRTVCNMLIHCAGNLLGALVNEQVAVALVQGLLQLPAKANDKPRTLLRTTCTQAIAHLLRHLRTPSSLSFVGARAKVAILLLFSRQNVANVLWDGVAMEAASCELAVASLNVLNSFLDMRVERESQGNTELTGVEASKSVLLEKIVSFSVIAKVLERKSRYEDANRQENLRDDRGQNDLPAALGHQKRYAEEGSGIPNLLRAKAILFIHLGMQASRSFTSVCSQLRYLELVDQILIPFASHIRSQHDMSDDKSLASSSASTSHTDISSPSSVASQQQRNARLSAIDVYMLQCALNLIKMSIRSALKLSADCISSYESDDTIEDRLRNRHTITSTPFEIFDLLLRNPMCKGQLVSYFVANEGKEYTFFLRLMAKLLAAFPNETLSGTEDVKVAVFVSELLLRLFQGTSSDTSLLLSVEIETLFTHLLPAIALHLERPSANDEDYAEELVANCIRVLYLTLLHFQYDAADEDCHDHRDRFVKHQLLPSLGALFANSNLNENVWHFGVELLYALASREPGIIKECETVDLADSILSMLRAPRQLGFHALPVSATKLVKLLVDSRKGDLEELYPKGIVGSLLTGLDFVMDAEVLPASLGALLEILYELLSDRYEKLRSTDAQPPGAPQQFNKLVNCGSFIVSLCALRPGQVRHRAMKSPQPQESPTRPFPALGIETVNVENVEYAGDNVADLASRCLVFLSQIFGDKLNDVVFAKSKQKGEDSMAR